CSVTASCSACPRFGGARRGTGIGGARMSAMNVGADELNDRVYHVHARPERSGARNLATAPHSAALSAATTINNGSVFAWPGVEGLRARGNTGSDCKIRGCRRAPPARTFRRLADCNCNQSNGPYYGPGTTAFAWLG